MTAEVVVMNRYGAALAADSYVTVASGTSRKTYATTDKLFCLSASGPIAVLTHGSAELMGVPWELAIRAYADRKAPSHPTVREVAEDFFDWLGHNDQFFPRQIQAERFDVVARHVLVETKQEIVDAVEKQIRETGSLSHETTEQIASRVIEAKLSSISEMGSGAYYDLQEGLALANEYAPRVEELVDEVFGSIPMSAQAAEQLRALPAGFVVSTFIDDEAASGVVFVGYGAREVYPSLAEYHVDSVIADTVRARSGADLSATDAGAAIFPLAQRDTVDTLLRGVAAKYEKAVRALLHQLLERLPDETLASIETLDDDERKRLALMLADKNEARLRKFEEELDKFATTRFVQPVLGAVRFLPKGDLAELAEALVNLTKLRLRMSIEDYESVGGAVDVAVVSKTDGFVWVKRKQYFASAIVSGP